MGRTQPQRYAHLASARGWTAADITRTGGREDGAGPLLAAALDRSSGVGCFRDHIAADLVRVADAPREGLRSKPLSLRISGKGGLSKDVAPEGISLGHSLPTTMGDGRRTRDDLWPFDRRLRANRRINNLPPWSVANVARNRVIGGEAHARHRVRTNFGTASYSPGRTHRERGFYHSPDHCLYVEL